MKKILFILSVFCLIFVSCDQPSSSSTTENPTTQNATDDTKDKGSETPSTPTTTNEPTTPSTPSTPSNPPSTPSQPTQPTRVKVIPTAPTVENWCKRFSRISNSPKNLNLYLSPSISSSFYSLQYDAIPNVTPLAMYTRFTFMKHNGTIEGEVRKIKINGTEYYINSANRGYDFTESCNYVNLTLPFTDYDDNLERTVDITLKFKGKVTIGNGEKDYVEIEIGDVHSTHNDEDLQNKYYFYAYIVDMNPDCRAGVAEDDTLNIYALNYIYQ